MSGATECPTKPKGRPRKNSYYPASGPVPTIVTSSLLSPVSLSRQSSEDSDSMDQDSEHWREASHGSMQESSAASPIDEHMYTQPDSPPISVTD